MISRKTYNILVNLLTEYLSYEHRSALLTKAFYGTPLLTQFDLKGSSDEVASSVVDKVLKYGRLNDTDLAIVVLLEELKAIVGHDRKAKIEELIQVLHDEIDYRPNLSEAVESSHFTRNVIPVCETEVSSLSGTWMYSIPFNSDKHKITHLNREAKVKVYSSFSSYYECVLEISDGDLIIGWIDEYDLSRDQCPNDIPKRLLLTSKKDLQSASDHLKKELTSGLVISMVLCSFLSLLLYLVSLIPIQIIKFALWIVIGLLIVLVLVALLYEFVETSQKRKLINTKMDVLT